MATRPATTMTAARIAILTCALATTAPCLGQLPPAGVPVPRELESSVTPDNPVADLRQTQLEAARANAAVALRESILSLDLGGRLRVRDLVDRTRSTDLLNHALSAAQPIGGVRWIDDQTCQVQLAVQGSAVADAVTAMVARGPVPSRSVRSDVLSSWRRTAFSATGNSAAGGSALRQVRPPQSTGRWAEVSDDDCRRVLAAAKADAVHQASDAVRRAAASLGNHPHLIEALDRPIVAGRVHTFLEAQPVSHIAFMDDLTVSFSMAVDGAALGRAAQRAVSDDQPKVASAMAGDWARFRSAVVSAIPPMVTGTAAAPAPPAGVQPSLPAFVLPLQPPEWVDGVLQSQASAAPPRGSSLSRLKVKGLADAAAVADLRTKLFALRVGPSATLADAARADPQIAAAVSRVLLDAHESRVSFNADGSVGSPSPINAGRGHG
jgi:hypothetical protein